MAGFIHDMNYQGQSIVDYILEKRGYTSPEEKESFLNPKYESLHNPFLFKSMDIAVERILNATALGEKIGIFTDYDADGLPGGAILSDFLEKVEHKNYVLYIPNRETEGFGLNMKAVDFFKEEDVKLIITIDCGITDIEEVDYANKHNIDCIITDHHLPGDVLPHAYAIIDTKQKDCPYPFKELCGSGVIWKVVCALIQKIHAENSSATFTALKEKIFVGYEKWLLDLVAIATCSDMVPLVGENRTLVHFGLRVLQKNKRPGLRALFRFLRVDPKNLTEEDISFTITPRINAASRMSHPIDAYNMLAARDEDAGEKAARHLNELNDARKGHVAQLVKQAKQKLAHHDEKGSPKIIVVGDVTWKPGLLGLIANSLMNDFNCPVFVWGRGDGDEIKGSARSPVDGLVEIMKKAQEEKQLFIDYGGHEKSGGFSLKQEFVDIVDELINKVYAEIQDNEKEKLDTVEVAGLRTGTDHIEVEISQVLPTLWSDVQMLAPFGIGNSKPIFKLQNLYIKSARIFGKTKEHVECVFSHSEPLADDELLYNQKRREYKAIHFFSKFVDRIESLSGKDASCLVHCEVSYFGGKIEKRFRIIDIMSV